MTRIEFQREPESINSLKMAKRFTDTDKWKKQFIRGLEGPYKLLWFYILDDCDHAGIWQVDFEVARIRIGEQVEKQKALNLFSGRIEVINSGSKWFLRDFIDFQYGELNEKNRMHLSVINILKKNNISPIISPLQGAKDMDKDKDKVKDMVKEQGRDFSKPDISGDEPKHKFSESFSSQWAKWKEYRWTAHSKDYSKMYAEQSALDQLKGLTEEQAIKAINQAISSNWFNLYPSHDKPGRTKSFEI